MSHTQRFEFKAQTDIDSMVWQTQQHTAVPSGPSRELHIFLASLYHDYQSPTGLINFTNNKLLTTYEFYNKEFVQAVGHDLQLGAILKGTKSDSSAARQWTLNQVKMGTEGRAEGRQV